MSDAVNINNYLLHTEAFTDPTRRPIAISETGLRQAVLEDLALKALYLSGPFSIVVLSDHTGLSFEVASELVYRLRAEQLCQVAGMSGNIPTLAITTQGRARAQELLSQSLYTGFAPVSLASYVEQVKKQATREVDVHPDDMESAFAHLVIDDETLWQLGTAVNSGAAIFLHGPPGMGKSTIAETLSRVIAEDKVWIPHAVEVDGQIITVYDPLLHNRVKEAEPANCDQRWVLCERPAVLVGGELTVEMLDLQFNTSTKFYTGPIQMKANNGVLIIDDFGRQRIRPDELLNRWVVPLDRKIDFLTMAGGKKIKIPFEMLVVFATNMDPYELMDAAFLRRLQTKIRLGEPTDEQFCEIFSRVAADRGLEFEDQIAIDLIAYVRGTLGEELRSCYPRDIVNQVFWAAKYEKKTPHLDHEAVRRAIKAYFLRGPKTAGAKPVL